MKRAFHHLQGRSIKDRDHSPPQAKNAKLITVSSFGPPIALGNFTRLSHSSVLECQGQLFASIIEEATNNVDSSCREKKKRSASES